MRIIISSCEISQNNYLLLSNKSYLRSGRFNTFIEGFTFYKLVLPILNLK